MTSIVQCSICGKQSNSMGIKGHVWRVHTEEGTSFKPNKNTPWNKGLTKLSDSRLVTAGLSISKSNKGASSWSKMSECNKQLFREKARANIQKRYDNGWQPKAGRTKKIKYKTFSVDGTWELSFCVWADEKGIEYSRNTDRFLYTDELGTVRKYTPDFKLSNEIYVEVKGFQTDKDLAKWRAFPHTLLIIKRTEILSIQKKQFEIDDLAACVFV